MNTKEYLRFIVDDIHIVIVATVDEDWLPVTAAIDMMDADENSLYFLTETGKSFYRRLKDKGYLAFTALKGEDTMSSIAVSVRGKVKELGSVKAKELCDKNPYMYEIYPTEESRKVLTAIQIYEGEGNWYDLTKKPIDIRSFTFNVDDWLHVCICFPSLIFDKVFVLLHNYNKYKDGKYTYENLLWE